MWQRLVWASRKHAYWVRRVKGSLSGGLQKKRNIRTCHASFSREVWEIRERCMESTVSCREGSSDSVTGIIRDSSPRAVCPRIESQGGTAHCTVDDSMSAACGGA